MLMSVFDHKITVSFCCRKEMAIASFSVRVAVSNFKSSLLLYKKIHAVFVKRNIILFCKSRR